VLNIAGAWEEADQDTANIEWAREAWNDMKAFSTGGTYSNFLTEDEGPERIEAALGKGLQRLAEVKARWDPENVFRTRVVQGASDQRAAVRAFAVLSILGRLAVVVGGLLDPGLRTWLC
jgi:hypothetical protein